MPKPPSAASDAGSSRGPAALATLAGGNPAPAAVGGAGTASAGRAGMSSLGSAGQALQPQAAGTSMLQGGAGGAPANASVDLPALCSGCSQQTADKMDMSVHLHHVHFLGVDARDQEQAYCVLVAARCCQLRTCWLRNVRPDATAALMRQ